MAVPGRRSLAAVAVPGCGVLLPACVVARAVPARVRLSSGLSSASPLVAAVRLALARSLRLGPPLAVRSRIAMKRNQPLRPWRRGNETNNHESPTRTTRTKPPLVSTCAQTKTKSARQRLDQKSVRAPPPAPRGLSPARSTEPRSAHPAYALSLSNAGRRARMLTLMPAGAQPSDHLGCRVSRLHSNPSSNGTSLGRRCGHRAAFTGYRTPSPAALSLRARATGHPSSSDVGNHLHEMECPHHAVCGIA